MIIKEYQCPILGFFLNLRYGFFIDSCCVVGSIIEKGIVEILTVQELPQFFEKERILLPLVRGTSKDVVKREFEISYKISAVAMQAVTAPVYCILLMIFLAHIPLHQG